MAEYFHIIDFSINMSEVQTAKQIL